MKLHAPMPSLDGATWLNNWGMSREQLVGKPAFFHFWSVSCDMCKHSLGGINYIANKYSDELNVIAVHMPRTEQDKVVQNVQAVIDYYKMTQPVVIDNNFFLTNQFKNHFVPAYYLFDSDGLLRHYQSGNGTFRMLERRIQRIIEEYRAKK